MRKLAIVVGHNSLAQGAVRVDTGETEFVWNSRLAKKIASLSEDFGIEVSVFHRIAGGGYSREIERVYSEVDRFNPDGSIELHFNGAESPAATGTEVLSSGTALSLRLAASVQREIVSTLGLRDRGVKTIGGKSRGGKSLYSGKAPAILVEPFFGSSKIGTAATDTADEMEALAEAILTGSAKAFGMQPRRDITQSRTLKAAKVQNAANTGAVASLGGVGLVQIAQMLLGSAGEAQEAVQAVQPLVALFPQFSTVLTAIAVGLMIVSRLELGKITAARVDDFGREIR